MFKIFFNCFLILAFCLAIRSPLGMRACPAPLADRLSKREMRPCPGEAGPSLDRIRISVTTSSPRGYMKRIKFFTNVQGVS